MTVMKWSLVTWYLIWNQMCVNCLWLSHNKQFKFGSCWNNLFGLSPLQVSATRPTLSQHSRSKFARLDQTKHEDSVIPLFARLCVVAGFIKHNTRVIASATSASFLRRRDNAAGKRDPKSWWNTERSSPNCLPWCLFCNKSICLKYKLSLKCLNYGILIPLASVLASCLSIMNRPTKVSLKTENNHCIAFMILLCCNSLKIRATDNSHTDNGTRLWKLPTDSTLLHNFAFMYIASNDDHQLCFTILPKKKCSLYGQREMMML